MFAYDGMATFSAGLFGPVELPHFPTIGFFDERPAGFYVQQTCALLPCPQYANPLYPTVTLTASDTIYSDTTVAPPPGAFTSGALASNTLPSNYVGPVMPQATSGLPFGDWLPFNWEPKGIFWDFDNDPTTDADLVAWWNGSAWLKNYVSGFAPATVDELNAWASDPLYSVDTIEDTLNLGINYILKVGDNIDGDNDPATLSKFTVRIIPIVATDQTPPAYVTTPPPPLVPTTPTTPTDPTTPTTPVVSDSGGGGGGCSTATGPVPFDPTLPLLAALGLAGLGLRRMRRY